MTRKYKVKVKGSKDEVIDLVDISSHNRTTVARSKLDPELHESPIECIPEDKGQGFNKPVAPEDSEESSV
jgi:hypothetical protein